MAPNVDYDEDDYVDQYDADNFDGEEGTDELGPEDKISMANGVRGVRTALGAEASKVTLKQIQDALWHYYYDVDKSVVYLTKTFIAPAPKPPPKPTPKQTPKKATEGKSAALKFSESRQLEGLVSGAAGADPGPSGRDVPCGDPSPTLPFAARQEPKIPEQREKTTVIEPQQALPKMSKLQALAAARKRKIEAEKGPEKVPETENAVSVTPLPVGNGISSPVRRKLQSPTAGEPSSSSASSAPEVSAEPYPGRAAPKPLENVGGVGGVGAQLDGPSVYVLPHRLREALIPHQRHAPSAFAQSLFGSAPGPESRRRQDVFAMPYTSSSSFSFVGAFSEPSPDDIVLAAQAKAGKKTPASPKTPTQSKKAKDSDVANSVSNLKISEVPPPRSKGLDVLKEFENSTRKKSASFVVVGHVDAGKSTLMGRLLLELKLVEERTVEKYRRQAEKSGKQSFALAWIMDQRSEERERGVTIDIATNHFDTETTKFTILDAPGHRDFVPNMIAGASQADFAILVIDANTGAYEKGLKGQTREHVLLLRSLGVQRLIVAVNKLDMVGWSKERFQDISDEVSGFMTGLGFQAKSITFVPISGLNGDNIVRKSTDEAAQWCSSGPTLIEALEASGTSTVRALKKPFRMAISEVFRSQQGTATLAGRIDSGTIQIGDVVIVQPSGETAYIKSIVCDTEAQEWAVAGQNINLALSDIDPIHIRVGDILCHATNPISVGDTFTMKAMAFDHLMPMPVDLHRGRLHAAGQIQSMAATLDKSTGKVIKKKPRVVQPGDVARITIKLDVKVPLEAGQRVVVRSGGETIAAGLLE